MLYALPNEALLCLGYFVSLVQGEGAVYSLCLGLYDVCSYCKFLYTECTDK